MRLHRQSVGQGPDLVLLHGWGFDSEIWRELTGLLEPRLRVNTIDLPGHGLSEPPDRDMSLEELATLCVNRAPTPATWLGWSLGGLVALRAAISFPERVASLVLVASTPRFLRATDWPNAVARRDLEEFQALVEEDHSVGLARFTALTLKGSRLSRARLRDLRKNAARRAEPDPAGLRLGMSLLRSSDLRGRLDEVNCPVLLVLGEQDPLIPVEVAADLQRLMPHWRVHRVPSQGHAPFLEDPAGLAALVSAHVHV